MAKAQRGKATVSNTADSIACNLYVSKLGNWCKYNTALYWLIGMVHLLKAGMLCEVHVTEFYLTNSRNCGQLGHYVVIVILPRKGIAERVMLQK